MKPFIFSLLCLIYLCSPAFCETDIYSYVDDNGIKHFTENYADIPEKYRPQLKIQKSIESPQENDVPGEQKSEKPLISREDLEKQREQLDQEYSALIERRSALTIQKDTIGLEAYNVKAKQLNADIKAYQDKKNAYDQRVETYNQQQAAASKPAQTDENE